MPVNIINDQELNEHNNNVVVVDDGNVINQRRRRGIRRIPTRFIEPNFPTFVSNSFEWPRNSMKTRNSFLCNDPDYVMEMRFDPDDNIVKCACGWKNSNKFEWLPADEIKEKYPWILIDYYQRPMEFCDNNI